MSAIVIFEKSLREIVRDRAGLALTLMTAPLFVVFYAMIFQPSDEALSLGVGPDSELSAQLQGFRVVHSDDLEADVSRGTLTFGVVRSEVGYRVVGDVTSQRFRAGLPTLQTQLVALAAERSGYQPAVIEVAAVGKSDERSQFDLYVPNLLVFALIMLVFSAAMPIARESERGTLNRLRTTRLTAFQFLLGATAAQLVVGCASVALTLGAAMLFGFHAAGSLVAMVVIVLATAVACVSAGVLVAGFTRNVLQAFLVSSVFMFLLVLFSGLVFPVPSLLLLELLPTIHAVDALSAVLNLGAGFEAVWVPITKLMGLSVAFFCLGWARFAQLNRNYLMGRR